MSNARIFAMYAHILKGKPVFYRIKGSNQIHEVNDINKLPLDFNVFEYSF